jgi:1-acyl-sn-glycerol-3-phosphate acyltransferase
VTRGASRAEAVLFTAFVAVLVVVTMPPAWLVLLMRPRGRPSDRVVRGWARSIIALSGCPLHVDGVEHIPVDEPVVFVSNHASYIDSLALMAALPTCFCFVVAGRYARWPMVGTAIRKAGYITVNQRSAATRAASFAAIVARLRNGSSVLMYPEGHRSRSAAMDRFQSGAFRAAAETNRRIVPITVRGTRAIWPPDSCVLRRHAIDVIVHAAIRPVSSDPAEIDRLSDAARSAIQTGLLDNSITET